MNLMQSNKLESTRIYEIHWLNIRICSDDNFMLPNVLKNLAQSGRLKFMRQFGLTSPGSMSASIIHMDT